MICLFFSFYILFVDERTLTEFESGSLKLWLGTNLSAHSYLFATLVKGMQRQIPNYLGSYLCLDYSHAHVLKDLGRKTSEGLWVELFYENLAG